MNKEGNLKIKNGIRTLVYQGFQLTNLKKLVILIDVLKRELHLKFYFLKSVDERQIRW